MDLYTFWYFTDELIKLTNPFFGNPEEKIRKQNKTNYKM